MSALGTIVRSAATRALDAALPATCVGCHAEGPAICEACRPALDARLAAPAGVPIGMPGEIPVPLLQLDWCAPFHGVVRDALHAIKYQGEQRLAVPLGEAVARRWARIGVGAEIVTHVPVHEARARPRGYDQPS
jgi:predicted amidophosphoribosyltransferase